MQKFNSVDELINNLKPVEPVYCVRPSSIKSASTFFKKNFPGFDFIRCENKSSSKSIKRTNK